MTSDDTEQRHSAADGGNGLPRQAIEDELERVLGSHAFVASERLRSFLRYVVAEALAGRANRLQAHDIAVEVFGRGTDFDAHNDPVVRVEAGKLRRRLERYYLTAGRGDPIRIGIPKGGYAPAFARHEIDDRAATEPPPKPGPSGGQAIRAPAEPRPDVAQDAATHPSRGPRLAVRPLLNLSSDPDQDYFCAGITEQIIANLARFRNIVVVPLWENRGGNDELGDVLGLGRTFELDYLLRGSIRRSSARFRTTVDLTECEGGQILWTESYDRELRPDPIFEIQDEIAEHVAAMVGSRFGIVGLQELAKTRSKPPNSMAAYESVLRYYALQRNVDMRLLAEIRAGLERVVEVEPDYSEAWVALAQLYGHEYEFRLDQRLDDATKLERFERIAKHAVEVDPFSAGAHAVLSLAHCCAGDLDAFQKAGERALELNPNEPEFLARHGGRLAFMGEWDRGLALIDRAKSLNPYHPGWYNTPAVFYHYHRGDYAAALESAQAIDLPAWAWFHANLALVQGQLGQTEEARSALRKALEIDPDFADSFRHAMHTHGCPEALAEHLADGLRKAGLDLAPVAPPASD